MFRKIYTAMSFLFLAGISLISLTEYSEVKYSWQLKMVLAMMGSLLMIISVAVSMRLKYSGTIFNIKSLPTTSSYVVEKKVPEITAIKICCSDKRRDANFRIIEVANPDKFDNGMEFKLFKNKKDFFDDLSDNKYFLEGNRVVKIILPEKKSLEKAEEIKKVQPI